jgi:hypothetical protein
MFFNFVKCFCEKFGNLAQLCFFFLKNGGKSAIFSKIKKSEKKISALSVQFCSSLGNLEKSVFFFSSVVSTYFLDKIRQMFHLTKIEKQYCWQLKYSFLGPTQKGEGGSVRAGHSEPAPTNTSSTGCPLLLSSG